MPIRAGRQVSGTRRETSGRPAVNLTLLTYCDTCTVGINMDTAAVAHPDMLVECLRAGFEEVTGRAPAPAGQLQ